MKTLNVTEFREQCLHLLDRVPSDGVLITKRGRPMAKLIPVRPSCADLIGTVPGLASDPNDDLFSTGLHWDAES